MNRPRSTAKDLDRYVKAAWKANWRVVRSKNNGHIKVYPPGSGKPISVPMSPSAQATTRNVAASFKRAGLTL